MAQVVNGHVLVEAEDCPCRRTPDSRACPVCDWGLGICSVCGAAEIELDQPCTKKELDSRYG